MAVWPFMASILHEHEDKRAGTQPEVGNSVAKTLNPEAFEAIKAALGRCILLARLCGTMHALIEETAFSVVWMLLSTTRHLYILLYGVRGICAHATGCRTEGRAG